MSDSNPVIPQAPATPTPDQAPQLAAEIPTSGFEEFLDNHGKKTALLILLAIAAVGIIFFLKSRAESARVEAGEAFVSAATTDELEAVSQKYAGKPAGGNALLILADRQLDLDKADAAKSTLEKFVADYGSHPLYNNGVFALACVEEQLGNADAALAGFQKVAAAGPEAVQGALATLRAGDVQLAKGDLEAAKETYDGLAAKYPSSPFIPVSGERSVIADQKIILRDNPAPAPEPEPEPPTPDPAPDSTPAPAPAPAPDAAPTPAPEAEGAAPVAPEDAAPAPVEGDAATSEE